MKYPNHRGNGGIKHTAERAATGAPCAECPFKRGSMKGYLGPWPSPEEIIQQAFSEAGFVCHMTITDAKDNKKESNKHRICKGSLVCANKSAKLYRDRNLQRLQVKAEDPGDIMGAREFCEYHYQEFDREEDEEATEF